MRSMVLVIVGLAGCLNAVEAAPRSAHPQPAPSTTLSAIEVEGLGSTSSSLESDRAASQAKQDAFDKRIARKSQRVLSSVCSGCTVSKFEAQARTPSRLPTTADADAGIDDEYVVERADEAPTE